MKRPHVIINCAASVDGKIAMVTRRQTKISSRDDMKRVHELRSSVDAILVGIGTILADDPHLTVKKEYLLKGKKARNPLRIVLDSEGRIPNKAKVLDDRAETLVVVAKIPEKKIRNAEVYLCATRGRIDLRRLMKELHDRGVRKLLVEGGGDVIWSILKQGLADELKIFVGNMVIGGKEAPTIADGEGARRIDDIVKLELTRTKKFERGVLLEYSVLT